MKNVNSHTAQYRINLGPNLTDVTGKKSPKYMTTVPLREVYDEVLIKDTR